MDKIKERNVNLDLIRCFALGCIIVVHGMDNTGVNDLVISTAPQLLMASVRHVGFSSISLYLFLSGWLLGGKKPDLKYYLGYVRLMLIYLLCSLACIPLEFFHKETVSSLHEVISRILSYDLCGYAWYIQMYVGLFMVIPFLNMAYHACTEGQKRLMLLCLFSISVLPSLVNSFGSIYFNWWNRIYPLLFYVSGIYLKDHMPKLKPGKVFLWLLLALAAITVDFMVRNHMGKRILSQVYQDEWQAYLLGILIFLWLTNLDLSRWPQILRRLVVKTSELTLPIFMLTWIPDGISYPIMVGLTQGVDQRIAALLITVPFAFVTAFLLALVVDWLYRPLHRWIISWLEPLCRKLLAKLPPEN